MQTSNCICLSFVAKELDHEEGGSILNDSGGVGVGIASVSRDAGEAVGDSAKPGAA